MSIPGGLLLMVVASWRVGAGRVMGSLEYAETTPTNQVYAILP